MISGGANVSIFVIIVSLSSPTPSPSESLCSLESRGKASIESGYESPSVSAFNGSVPMDK